MRPGRVLATRRAGWLLACALSAALAGAAGWRLWHFWQTAWSMPLAASLSEIHFPAQVFNEGGALERPYNKAAVGLSLLAFLATLITALLRRGVDGRPRAIITLVGGGCVAMMLLTAWAMQSDSQVNGGIRKLADDGNFAELERIARRRPELPYGRYIGAQALVLAGKGEQLQRDYGPWLQDWGRRAAREGYVGPGMTGRELPYWEGMSASPRVMRALELLAFGHGTSVFSSEYEARVQRDTLVARRQGLPVGLGFALFAGLAAMAALRARELGRRIQEFERRRAMFEADSTQPAGI
ncbi:hypothetical protein ACFPOE_07940 [Caenimonas terrae]|uniref:DUF3592 domain-containing protein n=1 Tax=Caenimonas terrae TaxID=696074 RepID=A0ABW0N9W1_9BURK